MTLSTLTLTDKQEEFARHYAAHRKPAAAYRFAYDCRTMNPDSVSVEASRCIKNPKIALRIHELRINIEKEYTVGVAQKKQWLAAIVELSTQRKNLENGEVVPAGDLAIAIKAINELNKMEGDHAAIKNDVKIKQRSLTMVADIPKDADPKDAAQYYLDVIKRTKDGN